MLHIIDFYRSATIEKKTKKKTVPLSTLILLSRSPELPLSSTFSFSKEYHLRPVIFNFCQDVAVANKLPLCSDDVCRSG